MVDLAYVEELVRAVELGTLLDDAHIHSDTMGDGTYIQIRWRDRYDSTQSWSGRKWYVSPHSTDSEIVMIVLKAFLTALEHEAREAFTFLGIKIVDPHFNVHTAAICPFDQDLRESK